MQKRLRLKKAARLNWARPLRYLTDHENGHSNCRGQNIAGLRCCRVVDVGPNKLSWVPIVADVDGGFAAAVLMAPQDLGCEQM